MRDGSPPMDGRAEAFDRLYRDQAGAVLAYLLRRASSLADAHDALAETFLVAWRRPDQVPDGDGARLWLYAVGRRVLANQRRSNRRRRRLGERLATPAEAAVVPGPDEAGGVRDVLAALSTLAEQDREILLLAAWEGLSHADVARVLGCSENASAIRLHRARARLRQAYTKGTGVGRTPAGGRGD